MTRSTSSRGKGTAIAAALLIVPLIVAAAVYHERIGHWLRWGDPLPLAPDLERLLAWFPEDTQSLMVARDAVVRSQEKDPESKGALELTQFLACMDLLRLRKGACAAQLEGRQIALVIAGSRRFRQFDRPAHEGCHILVFDGDLGAPGDRLMIEALQDSQRALSLAGYPVAVLDADQDVWFYYLVRISSNALLLATDERFLEEVLRRRRERPARRAFPDEIPEWREIDRAAPFWAVRHYGDIDRQDADEDASSPFGRRMPIFEPDEHAVGFAFSLRVVPGEPAASSPRVRLVYFSASADPAEHLEQYWKSDGCRKTRMRPLREGAFEILPEWDVGTLHSPPGYWCCLRPLRTMLGHSY